jgi:FMN phosphatase YigB (HAD superfamily)
MLQGVFFDFGDTVLPWSATLLRVHRLLTWPTFRRFKPSVTFRQLQDALKRVDQQFALVCGQHTEIPTLWIEIARQLGISSFSRADATAFDHQIWQRHLQIVRPYPGVFPLLRWLRNSRLKLAIVSNAWNHILHMYLDRLTLRPLFDVVVTSEDAGALKSQLIPYQLALIRLKLAAEDVLHIGDRPDEDGACQELGIRFAWLVLAGTKRAAAWSSQEGKFQYDFRVSSYSALRKAIHSLLRVGPQVARSRRLD